MISTEDEEEIDVNSLIKDPSMAKIFPHRKFNPMQSLIADQLLHTDDNMVIAAPTGSGKTVCHELAIVRSLQALPNPLQDLKCVFIAPNKAICQQRAVSWAKSFVPFGLSVIEITGDIEVSHSLACVARANIVITTPEKWDALTRSWRKHIFLLGCVNLLLLDEIHHLQEDRGAVLETVVVRMRVLAAAYRKKCPQKSHLHVLRVIALSATLPNIHDIGQWLQCSSKGLHTFDETFRPVPLKQVVVGYPQSSNDYFFEKSLDRQVPDIIRKYSKGHQALVFCPTKKGTEDLCNHLASSLGRSARHSPGFSVQTHDEKLRNLMGKGYAYHHSGVSADDRATVENMFNNRHLSVLCATSTLAHGVNLPAFLVVIRGTNMWQGKDKGYQKMHRSTLMQMCGRAGRPGFDDSGIAVVMTSVVDKEHFENLINHCDVVESSLPTILTEVLCAEISEEVVTDVDGAISWLRDTFFYVRVHKNPEHYGISTELSEVEVDNKLKNECLKSIHLLERSEIITLDSESRRYVTPRAEAYIMTRNMLKYETMVTIMQIPTTCCPQKLLEELSHVEECQKPIARNQKKLLNDMHKASKFSTKMKVKESSHKTLALLAAAIERAEIKENSMRVEQMDMVDQSMRVLSAIHSYALEKGKGKLLESAIYIRRSLGQRLWMDESNLMLAQAPDISTNFMGKLLEKQISLEDISDKTQQQIQQLTNCSASDAQRLLNFGYACCANKALLNVDFTSIGKVCYSLQPPLQSTTDTAPSSSISMQLISYHYPTGKLVCYRKVANGHSRYQTTVNLPDDFSPDSIHTSLISNYIGLDVIIPAPIAAATEGSTDSCKKRKRVLKQSRLQATKVDSIGATEALKHERAQEIISKRATESKISTSPPTSSTPGSPSGSSMFQEYTCDIDSPHRPGSRDASKPFFKQHNQKDRQRQTNGDNHSSLSMSRRREEEKEDAHQGDAYSIALDATSNMSNAKGLESAIDLDYLRSKSREMGLDKVNVSKLKRSTGHDEMNASVATPTTATPNSLQRRRFEEVDMYDDLRSCNSSSPLCLDIESLKKRHEAELCSLLLSHNTELYNANAVSLRHQHNCDQNKRRNWSNSSYDESLRGHLENKEDDLTAPTLRLSRSFWQNTPPSSDHTPGTLNYGHDFPDLSHGISFKRQQVSKTNEYFERDKNSSSLFTVSQYDPMTGAGSSRNVANTIASANVDMRSKHEIKKAVPDKVRVVSSATPDVSDLDSSGRDIGNWLSDSNNPQSRQKLLDSAFF